MLLPAEHELLLKIIEQPDDDQPRRVLADLLTDRGEPWGELIHVQCALERIRTRKGRGDYRALKERERELLKAHRARWQQQAAPVAKELEFRRGLPEVLHTTASALLSDGGLSVLAPIQELELSGAGAPTLGPVLRLPLIRRVRALALKDVDGASLHSMPPLPGNIRKLTLLSRHEAVLRAATRSTWFDTIDELVLSLRGHDGRVLEVLLSAKVTKVTLVGIERREEPLWIPGLRALLDERPGLRIGWRGDWYEAQSADSLRAEDPRVDRAHDPPENREPFGIPYAVGAISRDVPGSVQLERLEDGGLLATGSSEAFLRDAAVQLSLPTDPSRITAVALSEHRLRYEPWPAFSLAELGLPLPEPLALHVTAGIAEALHAYPLGVLSLHDVWVGLDGAVKLLPPLRHTIASEEPSYTGLEDRKHLGLNGDALLICGTALLHLLYGELPISFSFRQFDLEALTELSDVRDRPLLPSMLDPKWEPLDALVERCLTREHALRFATPHDLALAAYEHPLFATRDSLARHVRNRQSSPP